MMNKEHWENVYTIKQPHEVSWTQEIPQTSLDLIKQAGIAKDAAIIDIGGGDSNLADFLLNEGYTNITVLDISAKALDRAKERLGKNAGKVKWIVSDISEFVPETSYDLWHDRAAFHFLTEQKQVERYVELVNGSVNKKLIIGTFSENGPLKCSGLEISRYTEKGLTALFEGEFEKVNCFTENHVTPFKTVQNFIFCLFSRNT